MYIGRIAAIGCTSEGHAAALYRVSSRSFPHRRCVCNDTGMAVLPKRGYEEDIEKNPYIAYNCLRLTDSCAVATNGSHTDPITEKIAHGTHPRDALISTLYGMDYEPDHLSTPRLAAVLSFDATLAYLGIVREDALLVRSFSLSKGTLFYLGTYEHNAPSDDFVDTSFNAINADEACSYILNRGVFADYDHPVTAAAAVANNQKGFSLASEDVQTT
mgnify:CR=1 FL=1